MDLIGLGAGLTAFLAYYNTLNAGFVYDDRRAILNNQDVLPTTPISSIWYNDFWGTPITSSGSHGSYRPLCVLTFRLNYIFGGGFRPFGFHLVNVLLHTVCTYLVVKLARTMFRSNFPVFFCGLLFSVHPIHTEAVAGIVGRADITSCIFYIISFLSYLKHVKYRIRISSYSPNHKYMIFLSGCGGGGGGVGSSGAGKMSYECLWLQCIGWLALCLVASACAMLSKEVGLTVLVVCAFYDVLMNCSNVVHLFTKKRHRGQLASMCTLGLVLFGLLLVRLLLMGAKPPEFASSDNPSSRCPSSLTRTLTFLYLPSFNFLLLLFPKWLSFDWSMDAIPRINSLFDPRNFATLFFYHLIYKIVSFYARKISRNRPQWKGDDLPKCLVCKNALTQHWKLNNNNNNNNYYLKYNQKEPFFLYKNIYAKCGNKCDCSKCLKFDGLKYKYKSWEMSTNRGSFHYNHKSICHSSVSGKTSAHVVLLSFAFLIIPFIPATNLFFYVGFVIAERVLYIPSIGYCLLISFGCNLIYKRTNKKAVILCATFVLVFVYAVKTLIRNNDWNDEESLYRSGIPINPPKSYGNLGSILNAQGRGDEAEEAYKMALKHRPNMADVYYNLGVLQQGRMQYQEAILSYQMAIQYRPSLALAHLNLGQLLASQGRCEEAAAILRRCSQLDSTGLKDQKQHETTRISALLHLGRLYADQGRYHKAVSVYLEAVHAMPQFYQPQVLYNLLGDAYSQLKQTEEAEKWFKAALQAKPDHIPAHLTYGKLLAKNRTRVLEAEQWFLRAKKLAPTEPAVYQHFGQFLSELERHSEAAAHYVRAAELAPGEYEAVVNAATALRQADQKNEAEKYYRQAVKLRPEDARSHSNLGAMLHLNGKYKEAAKSYKHALKLQPGDITTLSNLHKLKSLMSKLET